MAGLQEGKTEQRKFRRGRDDLGKAGQRPAWSTVQTMESHEFWQLPSTASQRGVDTEERRWNKAIRHPDPFRPYRTASG